MSDRTRRLFFALWPDDATRLELFHWQTYNLPADVRWQHRADLHMTLHFLGQVEPDRFDELLDLGKFVGKTSFDMLLDEIGYWPKPQVLWAGPTTPPAELLNLQLALGEGLHGLGFATEERPFRAHVTLARRVRERPVTEPLAPLAWSVSQLALVESRPGRPPMYHPVGQWALD